MRWTDDAETALKKVPFYKQNSKNGKRFAEIFTPADYENLSKRCGRMKAEG